MGVRSPQTDTDDRRDAPSEESTTPARPVARIRYSRVALLPLMVGVICAIPLAIGLGPWGLLVLMPFVLAAIALVRVGADITEQAVVVRGAMSSLTVRRDDIAGIAVPDGQHVHLVRTDGSSVRIPAIRPRDLPRLRSALFGDSPSERPAADPAVQSVHDSSPAE